MKLSTPLKTLGPVDHRALKAAVVGAPPEKWTEEQLRQKAYDVHAKTHSILLLFAEGWPDLKVSKRRGWDEFSPVALPVIREIVRKYYSVRGTIIRAMFAKLLAGGSIDEHYDEHPSFSVSHRIHVPLVTNDEVDFFIAGENHHLKEGIAYEVSNLDYHSVVNRGSEDRVHFIFDYIVDPA